MSAVRQRDTGMMFQKDECVNLLNISMRKKDTKKSKTQILKKKFCFESKPHTNQSQT